MAISSSTHRSLSPVSRNSQGSNGGLRRSFNGNPLVRSSTNITPVNSPSDSSRKSLNLNNKEAFGEFKENEKKVKQGSIQRGTKSFMAPTISAISKKSPSTRKKVLSERNETVRSSINEDRFDETLDCQVTHSIHSFKPRSLNYQPAEADSVDIVSTQPSNPLEFSEETAFVLPDSHEPNTISMASSENPPYPTTIGSAEKTTDPLSSPYPVIAPLDSDPHLPPYDPKTNYLSPRPRYLHYKPKPRIDVFLENERGVEEGKKLEESFSSSSCSDTEETPSSGSGSDDDECSSEEENQTIVSQPKLDYTQTKRPPSSRSLLGSKIAPFLLVLVIACLSFQVIDTPVLPQSAYQVHTFSMDATLKIVESVKVNFEDLASNLKIWSSNTVSYLSMLISIPGAVQDLGPLYFSNTTVFSDASLVYDEYRFGDVCIEADTDQIVEMGREAPVITKEEEHKGELQTYNEVAEHIITTEFEQEPFPTQEILGESQLQDQENLDHHTPNEPVTSDFDDSILPQGPDTSQLGACILMESEGAELDVILQTSELDDSALTQSLNSGFLSGSNQELDDSALTQSLNSGFLSGSNQELDDSALMQSPVSEPDAQSTNSNFLSESEELDVSHQDGTGSLQLDDGLPQGPEFVSSGDLDDVDTTLALPMRNLFSAQNIGIMLSVVTVAAAAAYVHLGRKKARVTVKPSTSSTGDSGEHQIVSPPKSSKVVVVDDSCCSEVSSSFKRSSSPGLDDTLSNGKRHKHPKREVMPCSSEYSYGSFTTYEKIHSKHGWGEDEVVTPVRRSSRIRKITSP